jgi:23S rRNA pseudouridine1911/1915/1917 synthase
MIEVLYEDNHCLVVNKPAGLLTQGDATGAPTLLDAARTELKARHGKPGNVYLGLVHRLDQPTSGAVLLARTSKAAARLSAQFRAGRVEKIYWAVVEGVCPEEAGQWSDTLLKDERRNVVRIVPEGTAGGRAARVAFRVLERRTTRTVLELRPLTGRGHQLRAQLAARGLPIVGDRKYGATSTVRARDGRPRIALHARGLSFSHPTRPGVTIAVSAPVPPPPEWPATTPPAGRTIGSSTPGGPPAP